MMTIDHQKGVAIWKCLREGCEDQATCTISEYLCKVFGVAFRRLAQMLKFLLHLFYDLEDASLVLIILVVPKSSIPVPDMREWKSVKR